MEDGDGEVEMRDWMLQQVLVLFELGVEQSVLRCHGVEVSGRCQE